jgi:MFS transporter, OFA family, oxalate/formate antiporter
MQSSPTLADARPNRYGWVVVAACTLMIFVTYGLIYSYGVFFKPLAESFQWERGSVSLIYSLAIIIRGISAIGVGWLADKYSSRWIMVICGVIMAAGYLLSSRVTGLWQFFFTYAVIEAIGMSGAWGICTAVPARWFAKQRGLVMGIVTAGSGLGTLLIVPFCERMVSAYDWPQAFVICGIGAGVLMVIGALFLKNPPEMPLTSGKTLSTSGASVRDAMKDMRMWLIILSFFFFFFGSQIVLIHIVNHATDVGIDPLIAATFVSVIGLVSIFSRLAVGAVSDKMGLYPSLIVTCFILAGVFILLIFDRAPWAFYVTAVLFGVPYGAEVTQIPLVIGRFFGVKNMATLMGICVLGVNVGGAFGAWLAGWIFDYTDSYRWAFISGAAAAIVSVVMVYFLQREDKGKTSY